MARQKKELSDVMANRLAIQLTAAQKERLRQAGGANLSAWARTVLLAAADAQTIEAERDRPFADCARTAVLVDSPLPPKLCPQCIRLGVTGGCQHCADLNHL